MRTRAVSYRAVQAGDYVLATKYDDGDPQDHWFVGFVQGMSRHTPPRFDIWDGEGRLVRGNGFRRAEVISPERGTWLLENREIIATSDSSLWWWVRQPMEPVAS